MPRSGSARATVAVVLFAVAAVFTAPVYAAGSRSPGPTPVPGSPPYTVPISVLAKALHCPATFPRVARPVVFLVHGTSVTDEENWSWNYAKSLPRDGFDFCTVLLPNRALSDIQLSAEYVVYGIREIAQRSGRKVSTIGLSQGPLEPRWALKWWPDLRPKIDDFISMAGTNHGANYGDAACTPSCAAALWQQRPDGEFLRALNAGDETPGPASYTSVYSLTDPIVQPSAPVATAALEGAANIAVQDICPGRPVDHIQSAFDAVYYAVVMDALLHPGPADPKRIDPAVCAQTAMPGVDPLFGAQKIVEVYLLAAQVQAAYPKSSAEPPLACYAAHPGRPSCLVSAKGPSPSRSKGTTATGSASPPRETAGSLPSTGGSTGLPTTGVLALLLALHFRTLQRRRIRLQ